MRKQLLSGIFSLLPFLLLAQNETTSLDQRINDFLAPITQALFNFIMTPLEISETISIPIVLILLISAASFFTLYFRFPNLRYFRLAINLVRGRHQEITRGPKDDGKSGSISPLQALTAALSATVGLGNIGSVAIAIATGGPGATFWMIVAGLLGMSSKFTECTLGVRYRQIDDTGYVYGGPMYYLRNGLGKKGWKKLGKALAVLYAIMLVGGSFGGGNMFQSNQATAQFLSFFPSLPGYAGLACGVILAILVAIVIIGGIQRIGAVTEKVVPFMVGLYVLAAIIILASNISALPLAISQIFQGAFTPSAAVGGFLGALIQGFQRAAFSNEAGVGSASVAHSAVRTQYAASEGVVALLEPFIDTVVVCTMTALVIIISNTQGELITYGDPNGLNGVNLTSAAFDTVLPGFSYVLTIAVILFAFSTMLAWSYYGLQAWKFLFGHGKAADIIYKALFCTFVALGGAISLGAVVQFSDAMIFAMIFPNMIGLLILAPEVKDEIEHFIAQF